MTRYRSSIKSAGSACEFKFHDSLDSAIEYCESTQNTVYSWSVWLGMYCAAEYESDGAISDREARERLQAIHEERWRRRAAIRSGPLQGFTND